MPRRPCCPSTMRSMRPPWFATRADHIEGHIAVDATVVDPALAAAASRPVGRLVRVPNARPPNVHPTLRGIGA